MAHGRKTGGRKLGSLNKATVQRALLAERAAAEGAGKRLAKDVLQDFMELFVEAAAHFRERGDWREFERWALHTVDCAKSLAPYQSPRLSALAIGHGAVSKIKVVGGMPDDFTPPSRNVEFSPGTIVTADDLQGN
jgi:hypothetical protein